jgi:hypothetical protein
MFGWLRVAASRIRGWFTIRRLDEDFQQELDSHLALLTEENLRRGLVPEQARRAARLRLGGLTQLRETHRELQGLPWLETLIQDVRYALRTLRKNLGFTTVAVLTLALGIGANTAIFSVVEGVMLAPLPFSQPDRLMAIWESHPNAPHVWISYPNFRDWQRNARSFQQMVAFAWQGSGLTSPGTPEHVEGMFISAGFFNTLGVRPALGREFSPQEDQHGGAPVVMISHRLWRNRFAGSREALGKLMTLDGMGCTLVGVLPPGFDFEGVADVYRPLGQGDPLLLNNRAIHPGILAVARLNPGVSVSQAQEEMSTIQKNLDQLYPDADRDLGTDVVPLKQEIVGNVGTGVADCLREFCRPPAGALGGAHARVCRAPGAGGEPVARRPPVAYRKRAFLAGWWRPGAAGGHVGSEAGAGSAAGKLASQREHRGELSCLVVYAGRFDCRRAAVWPRTRAQEFEG